MSSFKANSFRPQCESLGTRIVPAVVSLTQNVSTGIAVVTCNNSNDNLTITDAGTGALKVSGTGITGTQTLDARITKIQVNTLGGNDTVNYNVTNTMVRDMKVEVNLGNGNDTFTANQNGCDITGSADEIMRVVGGAGADRITVNAANGINGEVNVASGASLQLQLLGGSNFDIFDAGDVIAVDYTGQLKGNLMLQAEGGLGNDSLRATVTMNSGSNGFVKGFGGAKARLDGGFGADTIDFRVRDNSGGSGHVSAEANAGLDFDTDTVRHTANVSSVFAFGDGDQVVV